MIELRKSEFEMKGNNEIKVVNSTSDSKVLFIYMIEVAIVKRIYIQIRYSFKILNLITYNLVFSGT